MGQDARETCDASSQASLCVRFAIFLCEDPLKLHSINEGVLPQEPDNWETMQFIVQTMILGDKRNMPVTVLLRQQSAYSICYRKASLAC